MSPEAIEFPIDGSFKEFSRREYPEFQNSTSVGKKQDVNPVQGAMGTPIQLVERGSELQHMHPEPQLRWNQEVLPASEFPGDYQKPTS